MRGHDTVPAAINARIGVKGVDGGKGGIDSGRPSPIVEPGALIQIPFPAKRKSPAGAGLCHLADTEGDLSNRVLETLEEWNEYLERHHPDFGGMEP